MKVLTEISEEIKDNPFALDAEVYLESKKMINALKSLYAQANRKLPIEYELWIKSLDEVYKMKIETNTEQLCQMLQKAGKWLELHPSWETDAKKRLKILTIYIGIVQELKGRGVGEYEALKIAEPKKKHVIEVVFGDLIDRLSHIY